MIGRSVILSINIKNKYTYLNINILTKISRTGYVNISTGRQLVT